MTGLDASNVGSRLPMSGKRLVKALSIFSQEQSIASRPRCSANTLSLGRRVLDAKGSRTNAPRGICLALKSEVASPSFASFAAVHFRGSSCFKRRTYTRGLKSGFLCNSGSRLRLVQSQSFLENGFVTHRVIQHFGYILKEVGRRQVVSVLLFS